MSDIIRKSNLNPEATEYKPLISCYKWIPNPDAVEFKPRNNIYTPKRKNGFQALTNSIQSSGRFPHGSTYDFCKSLIEFNILENKICNNVTIKSNRVINKELSKTTLNVIKNDSNVDKVVSANDSMLDRINISLDKATGLFKSSDNFVEDIKHSTPWNSSPSILKLKVGSTTLISAKNIRRPQLTFKDKVDNSYNLWVPKISEKPNNVKPLSLNIEYNDEGDPVGFEHPYTIELGLYHPPSEFIGVDSKPLEYPPPMDKTNLTYVDTAEKVDALVKHLRTVKEMAVDLEHHSYRTYQGITCLIQLSTDEGGDFIVDTLSVRDHVHKLNDVFTDPKKIKVFHGADKDVLWLQRDFSVYVVGLFDTHQAAKKLKMPGLSFKFLLKHYCKQDTDKQYQLADWRIRPLPEELVNYARMDTHYLLYIWRRMKSDLMELAQGRPNLLLSVFEQSCRISSLTYRKEVLDDNSHMSIYVRSKKSFNSKQLAALQTLFKWRDAQARALDESVTYLLPNHMLLVLAETLPAEVQGVEACCSPMPPFVKQNLTAIHKMLLKCRGLSCEPQTYEMPSSISVMADITKKMNNNVTVHDYSQLPEFREDQLLESKWIEKSIDDDDRCQPDIEQLVKQHDTTPIVSKLNVNAKCFVPPFDRYSHYRTLAQVEEILDINEKSNKTINITTELKEHDEHNNIDKDKDKKEVIDGTSVGIDNNVKRKRKIHNDKVEASNPGVIQNKSDVKDKKNEKKVAVVANTNPYSNADYKRFHNQNNGRNQKIRVKKHKM